MKYFLIALVAWPIYSQAHDHNPEQSSEPCSQMEVWDPGMAMCMPLAMEGMSQSMVHGNVFAVGITEQGPRGRDAVALTSMLMFDTGTSLGSANYLNLDLMVTGEKWTFPRGGYPLLLQIGEHQDDGAPFVDAQHPHSSPIMGLTLSDTFRFSQNEKNYLKLFFAPRGESTDGPIAFMHRQTGEVNPDAPLGHHIGQDVGHISSTVLGTSFKYSAFHLEASAFHGEEPEPTHVDLPMGTPNSFAFRWIQELSAQWTVMASVAHVKHPEEDDPSIPFVNRYSVSAYTSQEISADWSFYNSIIFGRITNLDHARPLNSFAEEFLFKSDRPRLWGRIERLQRTPGELLITAIDLDRPRWVTAFTLGYTHKVAEFKDLAELGMGSSATYDVLPGEFKTAYGGNPWTGKVFLQLSGMTMW